MNTIESARNSVLNLCNSLKDKDWEKFKNCFNTTNLNWKFIDVLPGGKTIFGSQKLIDLHPFFFQSKHTIFLPSSGESEFTKDSFLHEFYQDSTCQFFVKVNVTKPVEFTQKPDNKNVKLITIKNILALTYCFDRKTNQWWPVSITNTIVENKLPDSTLKQPTSI